MSSSTRLRRATLVAVLAVGVLSMHGLAASQGARADTPAPASAVFEAIAPAAGHGHDDRSHHDLGHALGELCLWLVVAAIVVTVVACGRRPIGGRRGPPAHRGAPSADARRPAGRPPDASLTGVALRC